MLVNIIKRYYEKHRFYHNFNHIKHMFDEATKYGIELSNEQYYAILFHDVVYQPYSSTNEEDSCKVFDDYVFMLKAVSFNTKLIKTMIMDTKTHIPTCEESKIVIDLDLCALGGHQYKLNSALIEAEYLYFGESEQIKKLFNEGRVKWLESFLERGQYFYTEHFKPLTQNVRINLLEEYIRKRSII